MCILRRCRAQPVYRPTMTDLTLNALPLLSSGIPGCDVILGGGFPAGSVYLLQGLAGSGKTTLACQIGFTQASAGKKVVVVTLIAETHGKMLNHLRNFSFFDEGLLGRQLMFFSGYGHLAEGGLRALLEFIAATLAEQKADILIVDGFRTVRESQVSDLGLSEFMLSLSSLVSSMGCTTFLLSPTEGNIADAENTLVDGLIELSQQEKGMQLFREIKVFKIRGSKHLLGRHVFDIGTDGIAVYPRLEAVSKVRHLETAQDKLLRFGVAGWDELTHGGVSRGSTTELLGNPGVGKTLMGLHFMAEGLRRGESCMIVGFYEAPAVLVEKARSVGIDLATALASGQLRIIWNPPLELLVDQLMHQVLAALDQHQTCRLLFDGMDGLLDVIVHEGRSRMLLTAFVNELRGRGVTTFITRELPYFGEPVVKAGSPSSVLFDNIMLMRYIDIGGVNHRQMAVLKLRQNGYDAASHLMRISHEGIHIDGTVAATIADQRGAQIAFGSP